ncbi:hypothetical protein [Petrachloros mirabilis]
MSWFRVVPVVWLILWMLVIPLIHVHPDGDHHGIADHVHGGVFHSVFSQDLDGEYGHHGLEYDAPVVQPSVLPFLGNSTGYLSHPEMGFSFLSSSPDRPSAKQVITDILFAEFDLRLLTSPGSSMSQDIFPVPILGLLANDLSARAPPKLSA